MKPGEHKTVQARSLKYAQDVGWTFVSREEAEERRAGFPTRQSGRDAGRNARAPLSLFPPEDQQKEVASALETCDAKANFAKQERVALQDIFRTLLHELMTTKIRVHGIEFYNLRSSCR